MYLRAFDWSIFGIAVGIMFVIAVVLGILILYVSKLFEVKKDSRVSEILEWLPKANCGGCGQAGCEGFANALISGTAKVNDCNPSSKEAKIEIANILGQTLSSTEETIAVVACCGGNDCSEKFIYQGYGTCQTQIIIDGGKKSCPAGCLGAGSCRGVCPNDAIVIQGGVALVKTEFCVSCGLCVATCPKKIIKRVPKSAKLFVACSTASKGKEVMAFCKNGCISCGICEKNCEYGAIHLVNNVPIIDYSKCTACFKCADKCPRKVIKRLG